MVMYFICGAVFGLAAEHIIRATIAGLIWRRRLAKLRKRDDVAAWAERRNNDVGGVVHRKG